MADIVLRISRHEDEARNALIRKLFGDDVVIITKDIPYNGSPVTALNAFVDADLRDLVEDGTYDSALLVAIEPSGRPDDVILITTHFGGAVPVIRPVFRRGDDGRVIVVGKDDNGRDLFDVETYERLTVEARPTLVGTPLT